MLYLRSWLEDYIDLKDYSDEDLKQLITTKSGEVEEVITLEDYFGGKVLIGKIENLRKHPDADRLKIFEVDLGKKQDRIQIVSAAPNSQEGMLIAVATVGTVLPMGTILEREMRGHKSQGMGTGMSELLLETGDSSGLWELEELIINKNLDPEGYLGVSICKVFPEFFPKDSIFDIKYLADKIAACGNHLGLALEIAITLERPELLTKKAQDLLDPAYIAESILQNVESSSPELQVHFADSEQYSNSFFLFDLQFTSHYHLPHTLQRRMFLTGQNLTGSIADLSNYLLQDIGQPTHFFSKQKVTQNNQNHKLEWRIESLPESTHFAGLGQLKSVSIPQNVAVIKQLPETILSIPAISGSQLFKTEDKDKEVLVEIANFPPQNVARSSFALNYRSEAARIFAGKVQISLQFLALTRLLEILKDSSDQNHFRFSGLLNYVDPLLERQFDISPNDNLLQKATKILDYYLNSEIIVDIEYLSQRLDSKGVEFWYPILSQKLQALGKFDPDSSRFYPNIFYPNIQSQEDLLDQVSRLIGYEALQKQSLSSGSAVIKSPTHHVPTLTYAELVKFKQLFTNFGFFEIITRPFLPKDKVLIEPSSSLELLNPANSNEALVRNTLFSNLMQTTAKNIFAGEKDIRIFEQTSVYTNTEGQKLQEFNLIEGLSTYPDPYLLTSLAHEIAKKLNFEALESTALNPKYSDLGQGYSYLIPGIEINLLKVNNKTKRLFDIPLAKDIWYIAIKLENTRLALSQYPKYYNETEFPITTRNYSYIISKSSTWDEISNILQNQVLKDIQIRIRPLERLTHTEDSDILNFKVDFVSYTRNLENNQIDRWEQDLLRNSNGILKPRY